MDQDTPVVAQQAGRISLKPYIQIARPDHWFKNVFMLPGVVFAIYNSPALLTWQAVISLSVSILATCLAASSNYTLNEILDASKDSLHPVKKNRPIPSGLVNIRAAYAEWLFLGCISLIIGWSVNWPFFLSLASLLFMGLIYNVPPVRLKDWPYCDVLSESLNNSLRLLLGWFAINPYYPPTLSLVMAYWMIGAFFMATKRYAEYKRIDDPVIAGMYRKSFSYYNEYRLLLSMVYYASAFGLFFGIFIVRYRIELILSIPFIAGFISLYMRIGFWKDSPVQYPENLYKQKGLVWYTVFCVVLIIGLLFIDFPIVDRIFQPYPPPVQ